MTARVITERFPIKKLLQVGTLWSLLTTSPSARLLSCTTIMAMRDGMVLAGQNEDMDKYNHRINFLPAAGHLFGCFYISWERNWPVNGMNDQGLFLGDNSIDGTDWKPSDDRADFPGNPRLHILQTCATVADVQRFFETYNVSLLRDLRIPIADRSGARMVVECAKGKVRFITEDTWYQVSTNFLRTAHPGKDVPCLRFKAAQAAFDAAQELTPSLMRSILSGTHQEGRVSTIYTFICDLKAGSVDLFFRHQFGKPVSFSLAKELQKGPRSMELASFFSTNQP